MEQPEKVSKIVAAVRKELSRDCAVIVGPWTGEVGFEILYWIPFVRWAMTMCRVPSERVIVVSRGGTASWYTGIGMGRYIDAFDLMSPAELASLGEGAKPKQSATSDEGANELLTRVKRACGLDDVARLLPHWMYRLYRYYWDGNLPVDFVEQHAIWTRVVPPLPDTTLPLPADFVAARFYFSRSFPDTEPNRVFARDMINRLAQRHRVVLLNQPFAVDDHSDYQPAEGFVASVAGAMTPATNLAVQTAVIGRASAFVGTYGGLSLLPPLCGVPSFAFSSVPFMKPHHDRAIGRMIDRAGGAPLRVAGATDGVTLADALLAGIEC
jgi:hypothetical protein